MRPLVEKITNSLMRLNFIPYPEHSFTTVSLLTEFTKALLESMLKTKSKEALFTQNVLLMGRASVKFMKQLRDCIPES